jgi:omega-amidase
MKISIIQTSLIWEDPEANRANFSQMINNIEESTDLIILPEMFATGFTMNPAPAAEAPDGASVQWMKEIAQANNCAITGSLIIEEDGGYYNRLFFVLPNGDIKTYNKRHLFSLAGEDKYYTAGTEKIIVDYKGWKICPLVCYDLRFPVFSRNVEEYDLLIYVANWPQVRALAWDSLLRARAIENLSYTVGVNRIGTDDTDHEYIGHSQVIDGLGEYVTEPFENEGVVTVELDKEKLHEIREKFAFLDDRDTFEIIIN